MSISVFCLFLGLFSLFVLFSFSVLSFVLFLFYYYSLEFCLFSKKRRKGSYSKREGRWEGTRRFRGRGNIFRVYCMRKENCF